MANGFKIQLNNKTTKKRKNQKRFSKSVELHRQQLSSLSGFFSKFCVPNYFGWHTFNSNGIKVVRTIQGPMCVTYYFKK